MLVTSRVTKTGGRDAATRHIPPQLALSVGKPSNTPPEGWKWSALTELARLESGHTPSRNHPEYWGGDIPWIGIRDAREHHGLRINDTDEKTNDLGIENSSARVLPTNTVCLSRTASVGYVVVMGRPMATSQDFVNWICSDGLDPDFLKYLFIAEDEGLLRFASGAVHQTIYFPEVKAFYICHPPLVEQKRIVGVLDEAFAGLATAQTRAESNLQNARALYESQLNSAFPGHGKGWSEKKLGDVAQFKNGLNFTRRSRGQRLRIVGVGNFHDNEVVPTEALQSVTINGELSDDYLIRRDDILTVRSNGSKDLVGRCMLVPETDGRTSFSGFLIRIRFDTGAVSPRFLLRYLKSSETRARLTREGGGANISSISQAKLSELPIALPSFNVQEDIADRLEALARCTQRLETLYGDKLAALATLNKSLLHQAFSGAL